jgi:hypothetical protein
VFLNIQPQIQQVKELKLGSTKHVKFSGFGALHSDYLAEASAIVEIAVQLHK